MISIGIVGAGQFARHFAPLFALHPGVGDVYVTDVIPERATALVGECDLAGTFDDVDALLASDVDAIAIFTQRWTHGPQAVAALEAGKHVYSTVPMAFTVDEVEAILDAVRRSGMVYMMGETSHYNPATVFARAKREQGAFGRVFYAEGDYVHDMDLGFYAAYQYSGGAEWKRTASFPPMKYPTHSIGGVLGALDAHAVSVSCVGIADDRDDGVFDRDVSDFGNDFSNASALFEMSDGGAMRVNEFRRVGYPSHIRESRFRFFGTEGSFEQLAEVSVWQDKTGVDDVSEDLECAPSMDADDPALRHIASDLRPAFASGHAPVHDTSRLPASYAAAPNGHDGSHQFLVDDFVTAVIDGVHPPVNAWTAARYTVPGLIAHESARRGGERLPIPDFGEAPARDRPSAATP
ncbi:MAG: oxidoreductase [Microbacterium sp.]|uniref:Gfo/Idh/MocA family protein n=1 Tax=unclassified Microbacterium TaxID=2609290 RepID=UPI000C3E395C|nr:MULTISPECIES: Gfo/Idh/MocA family oxidoreductase [unclassified Microbacterium]MAY51082.1 oxidoreductase [Microbacterium sp.]HAS32355.1 oxidoreductase [Microbacterium sp.]HBS74398.1 oxidoreductase [Microbacterium sp.]|tara:strand:+ start:5579 stop:6799 length:1221 start_codon:yes stop_codon:yes gene_type:complete